MVDRDICNRKNPFNYSEYTKEQNEIVFSYGRVFRFLVDDESDFLEMEEMLPLLVLGEFCDDGPDGSRDEQRASVCGPHCSGIPF